MSKTKKCQRHLAVFVVILIACFAHINSSRAAVFGDSDPENGVEDQRVAQEEAKFWPKEFRAVGRVFCSGEVQGTAILVNHTFNNEELVSASGSTSKVLTARHVLEGKDLSNCTFAPESDSWRRASFESLLPKDGPEKKGFLVASYSGDWLILNIAPWDDWQRYAIVLDNPSTHGSSYNFEGGLAHFVGFDVVRNKVLAHFDCQYGQFYDSTLLESAPELLWDSCDSMPGSSGGALFVAINSNSSDPRYRLAGIRVGSLFDETFWRGQPEMGDRFNLKTNINVTKIVNLETLGAD